MSMEVIAMPRGMGRPLAVLVLRDEQRSFLETQVRWRRVARAMAEGNADANDSRIRKSPPTKRW